MSITPREGPALALMTPRGMAVRMRRAQRIFPTGWCGPAVLPERRLGGDDRDLQKEAGVAVRLPPRKRKMASTEQWSPAGDVMARLAR
jgi:hypothetical protein